MGWLCMERKIGERIVLKVEDVEIEIMVSDIHRKRAHFAIKAPKIVQIIRKKRHILENGKRKT